MKNLRKEFKEDIDKIYSWLPINLKGKKVLKKRRVYSLWTQFSTEMYFAGFLVVNEHFLYEFFDWLVMKGVIQS